MYTPDPAWCPPRDHDFDHGEPTPGEAADGVVQVVICRKCPYRVGMSNRLTGAELAWAKSVVERYNKNT